MREILFRGKRKDNGEWVEGYYVKAEHHWHKHGIHEDWIVCGASANGGWFAIHDRRAVDPYTLGQYTGLTDKNNERVFEGDIIRDEDGDIYAVFYYEFYASYCAKRIAESSALFGLQDFDIYHTEVIGNIHDNPELLEVSK